MSRLTLRQTTTRAARACSLGLDLRSSGQLKPEEAFKTAAQAADLIAASEGKAAAADYLAAASTAMRHAGYVEDGAAALASARVAVRWRPRARYLGVVGNY